MAYLERLPAHAYVLETAREAVLLGGAQRTKFGTARFAVANLAAVLFDLRTGLGAFLALGANQHHVGNVDWHFLRELTATWVTLAWLDVLVDLRSPFDQDLALVGENLEDLASQLASAVGPGDDFDGVVNFDMH